MRLIALLCLNTKHISVPSSSLAQRLERVKQLAKLCTAVRESSAQEAHIGNQMRSQEVHGSRWQKIF